MLHKHEKDHNKPGSGHQELVFLLALLFEDSTEDRHKNPYSCDPEHQIEPHRQALLTKAPR